jgi:hypothetical protein
MGMTIDEAITWIITISEHEGEDIPIYDTDVEAIKTAVSTMRKYQKIEQILDDYDLEAWEVLEMIKKVIEDGKDD